LSLRELIGVDISKGRLKQNPREETGTDRIGALGLSDPLGAALWRITGDHDARAVKVAIEILAHRLRKAGDGRRLIAKLAEVALWEWLNDKCRKCGGRGFVIQEHDVRTACVKCNSTGIRRHADTERERSTGWTAGMVRKFEARFALAHEMLIAADVRVGYQVQRQLERGRR